MCCCIFHFIYFLIPPPSFPPSDIDCGDHLYTDAALSKLNFQWRTCLVVRELEAEVEAFASGRPHRAALKAALDKKDRVGDALNCLRLARQRAVAARAAGAAAHALTPEEEAELENTLAELLTVLEALDDEIAPLVEADGEGFSRRWGHLTRAGVNDRSQLMRQVEKYADIYTSRVSNLGRYTPYVYFRSPAQSMAHDRARADARVLGAGGAP